MTSQPSVETARAELLSLCPDIGDRGLDVLAHMYSSARLEGIDGTAEVGSYKISGLQGAVLHRLVKQSGALRTLEVGFAHGFSTVWLVNALPAGGRHVAIDPYERSKYLGTGLRQVQNLTAAADLEWRPALSIHALSDAIRAGERYDLIFIDGSHLYDDVIVDFYLADPLLKVGGILAFDDMWLPSVRTAVSFIATNRAYRPITQPEPNMAAFQKAEHDQRAWNHFVPFAVFRS